MKTKNRKEEHWVGSWATAPQLVEVGNMPPAPGLSDNTLRQVIRVSTGGSKLRLKFSNQYGQSPLIMKSVHLAVATGGSAINTDTDIVVRFDSSESVIIPAGQTVISDTLKYNLPELTIMAITICFANVPADLTGHPGSRTTSYILPENAVDAEDMTLAVTTDHWYVISGIDVLTADSARRAIVALGDSITDGRGSTTNGNDRWTDNLANRILNNPSTSNVAVLNQGIGGNKILSGGLGPTALSRFDRDVLGQSGVRYLIIFEGVNDIGESTSMKTADELIDAYKLFIEKAHRENILVYGA
ncbi:MAG: SGNH/GDSL hydrolase family protein, partial [Halanaerobiales bacterium]